MTTTTTHGARFRDAIAISNGACNPSGIALSITDACREMREHESAGTDQLRADPAIRLMVHQLSFLMGMKENGESYDGTDWFKWRETCEAKMAEHGLKPYGAT